MNKSSNIKSVPEEALKLLPWYATGWLSSQKREYMQQVLSENPEFQETLHSEYQMISAVKEDKTILDKSCLQTTEVRLNNVLSRLPSNSTVSIAKKEVTTEETPKQSFLSSLALLFTGNPSKMQYAAFATITTFTFALLFAFVAPLVDNDTVYTPASASDQMSNNSSTTVILVGLSTEPKNPQLLGVLAEINAQIQPSIFYSSTFDVF